MNQRDITRIAQSLGAASRSQAFHTQSKSSLWAFYLDTLADALVDCNPNFDRAAFLAECRGDGAREATRRFMAELEATP